jgi:hypothetical protein
LSLRVRPISFKAACAFIKAHHRHHPPPQGCKFAVAAVRAGKVVGVATAGRPVARESDDGITAEVTRVCSDGTPNVCSFLYARVRRVCQAMGYEKFVSYILDDEPGTSLVAAGFAKAGETEPRSWDRPKRRRTDKHPTQRKQRFESRAEVAA